MSLYFLYCVRYLVFFVLSYLFGCYHFLMNKDVYNCFSYWLNEKEKKILMSASDVVMRTSLIV